MPRTPRIFQRALCYHVMNRGINRGEIFDDELDRKQFVQLMAEYKDLCGAKIYHWCLMDTHYHMLVEVVFDNLRPLVSGIQQSYAQYHHRRHSQSGKFWSQRFKSKPVEQGEYIPRCGRYIERNPVRAGLVFEASAYMWSSAGFYVAGREDPVTDLNDHLGYGEAMSEADRNDYRDALAGTDDDEWMRAQQKSSALGSEAFQKALKLEGGRFRRRRGRPAKCVNKR